MDKPLRVRHVVIGVLVLMALFLVISLVLVNSLGSASNPPVDGQQAARTFTVIVDGVPITAELEGRQLCVSAAGDIGSQDACFDAGTALLEATGFELPTGTVVVTGRAPSSEVHTISFMGEERVMMASRALGPDTVFVDALPSTGVWTVVASGRRGRWLSARWDVEAGGTSTLRASP